MYSQLCVVRVIPLASVPVTHTDVLLCDDLVVVVAIVDDDEDDDVVFAVLNARRKNKLYTSLRKFIYRMCC